MSSYRDDLQETVVITSNTWAKWKALVVEVMKITVMTTSLIAPAALAETIQIEDLVLDRTLQSVIETIQIQDQYGDGLKANSSIQERIKINDHFQDSRIFAETLDDSLAVSVQIKEGMRLLASDQIRIHDQIASTLRANNHLHERLKLNEQYKHRMIGHNLIEDQVQIHDVVNDQFKASIVESIQIRDVVVTDQVHARSQINDHLKVREQYTDVVLRSNLIEEVLAASDHVQEKLRSGLVEQIHIADSIAGIKLSSQVIHDRLNAQDAIFAKVREAIQDSVQVADLFQTNSYLKQSIEESLWIEDAVLAIGNNRNLITDSIIIQDGFNDRLHAQQNIDEWLFAEDDIQDNRSTGNAWTANVDNWAMSRYSDFNYSSLVVVNGQLIGLNDQGIFVLDGQETVQGEISTGAIDLGKGKLVHPLGAYLEYELSGEDKALSVTVGTTQSGTQQQYTYVMPNEAAQNLTNGRVMFGRGLRGRHFSFTVSVKGSHAYLNDFNIDLTKTNRRV